MNEKKRTVILFGLLFIGIAFFWLLNHTVDTNFVDQL